MRYLKFSKFFVHVSCSLVSFYNKVKALRNVRLFLILNFEYDIEWYYPLLVYFDEAIHGAFCTSVIFEIRCQFFWLFFSHRTFSSEFSSLNLFKFSHSSIICVFIRVIQSKIWEVCASAKHLANFNSLKQFTWLYYVFVCIRIREVLRDFISLLFYSFYSFMLILLRFL